MAALCYVFALLFLFRVRLRGYTGFHAFIRDRYGYALLATCRTLEKTVRRRHKAELDLDFLLYCHLNDIVPNFVKFRLYKSSLYATPFYDETTKKLLDMEINYKNKCIAKLTDKSHTLLTSVKSSLSLVDFMVFKYLLSKSVNEYLAGVQQIHERKLARLGINIPNFNNNNKTVFNLSCYELSSREEFLLSLGLDFGLPCFKPSYNHFYGSLESLFSRLLNLKLNADVPSLRMHIQALAQKTYSNLSTRWTPYFSKRDMEIIKKLSKRDDIIITRPDKGKGTVILNRDEYKQKVENILSDESKFRNIGDPDFTTIFRMEDKINRFLKFLKDKNIISNDTYNDLYSTGASYGIMYGLPKIHKDNTPMRPILTSYNTSNYKIAKFLVPLLAHLTTNRYSLKNSGDFKQRILPQDSDLFMSSLDVESLFTNVPVEETIQIILDKIFIHPDTIFHNFNRTDFRKLLELAVLDTAFIFNGKAYIQTDGMAMGSPLGPTFANIFMCSLEERMLDDCPLAFHPLFYNRYVDDTFLLFRDRYQADNFLEYANNVHPNINFTIEYENNNRLPFLDILITRDDDHFNTTVFRKKTFTGLGANFYSHCYFNFKLNALSTLFHRAYTLTSDWDKFHKEIIYLHQYFVNNCYPSNLFYKYLKKFMNSIFVPKFEIPTVPKLPLYASVPFIYNKDFYEDLHKIVNKHLPAIKLKLIPINPLTIGSFFTSKERLKPLMTSGVVYSFDCPRCSLGKYVGCTRRLLKVRIDSHCGVSYRTGMKLSNPEHSNIRDHAQKCKYTIKYEDFKIIGRASNSHQLSILESLLIKQVVPHLNTQSTSTPLYIS